MLSIRRNAIVLSASLIFAASSASAVTLDVNTIQPFNTGLGTLNSVTVSIDPTQVLTSPYSSGLFETISNHTHTFVPPPITISGLGTFTFPFAVTNVASSGQLDDHAHLIDPGPSVKVFSTPSELAWFLNPSNPTITSLPTQFGTTSPAEGHQHNVALNNIALRTTYDYTPIPEPGSAALLGVAGLALARRRRR